MLTKEEAVIRILDKNYMMRMGASKLGTWIGTTPEIIREAKKEIRSNHYNQLSPEWRPARPRIPKVLLLDIETTPILAYVWGTWKQNISHESIVKPTNILSWSAKWLFDSKIRSDVLTSKEALRGDDGRIIKSIWNLLEEADIVIAQNGDDFDLKHLNTRFIINGLGPTMPYQSIDTLLVARKYFKFPSNKLDYLGQLVANKGKIKTDYQLWLRCMNGDKAALKYMVKYNEEDVLLLEEVYVWLRAWIKSHPNLNLYIDTDKPVCDKCTSTNLKWNGSYYTTQVNRYAAFRCEDCGAIGRSRFSSLSKEQRKILTVGTAR